MIRREHRGEWLIIDQIEHARVAAELARQWRSGTGKPQPVQDETPLSIWLAVAAHDDGWRDWDRSPRIDPETGIPREFREMAMAESTAIWTRSIERAAKIPLAAYAISKHFTHLAEHSLSGGHSGIDGRRAAERFLEEQTAVQSRLAADAHRHGDGDEFDHWHEIAYRSVQFFDGLSLWLCCCGRPEPQSFISPTGETVTLRAEGIAAELTGASPDSESLTIVIEPYSLAVEWLCVTAAARRIAARRYASDADLQMELSRATPELLLWWFVRHD